MEKNRKKKIKVIINQLELIEGINKDIQRSKKVDSPLMVRQYEHLKKEYTKNFLKLLEDYKMAIGILETA